MPSNTTNLGLYKIDTTTDGSNTFNIDTVLNGNWDKIDTDSKTKDDKIGLLSNLQTVEKTNLVGAINEVNANKADKSDLTSIESKNREQDRILANHEAIHDIDGRALSNSGKYYDLFDGTNNTYSAGTLDATKTNATQALTASTSAVAIPVVDVTGFSVGQEVTIYDDVAYERKIITAIDGTAKTLTVASLANSYKDKAGVARSMVSIDTANKLMNFGGWDASTTYDKSTPTTVVASAYDTSGNGGRKLVRLSNGWLVNMVYAPTDANYGYRLYVSKDNGATWSQLCFINNILTTTTPNGGALVRKGNLVYAQFNTGSTSRVVKIDVETQTNVDVLASSIIIDSSQDAMGNCSLEINETGTELHASWASKNGTYPNSFNIRYAKGTIASDGTVTWGSVQQVTGHNTSGTDHISPSIVVNSSGYPVIIKRYNVGTTEYRINVRAFNGTDWSTAPDVYNGGSYIQSNPSAVVDSNGVIHVSWHGTDSSASTDNAIRYSKSSDGGATWSVMEKLTSNNGYEDKFASITRDKNNKIYVLWQGVLDPATSTQWDILTTTNDGSGWTTISAVVNKSIGGATSPATLSNYTDFTEPLFIFMDGEASAVKFRGVWTEVTTVQLLINDARYNITPPTGTTDEVVGWIQRQKDAGFTLDGAISIVDTAGNESYVSATKKTYDLTATEAEDEFYASVGTAEEKATLRVTLNRTATTVDKAVSKVLGAVS
jgi:hypothetical protein